MPDSIKELCMKALAADLATVAGFTAAKVDRYPIVGRQAPDFPYINIFEPSDSAFDRPYQFTSHELNLMLEIWISGKDNVAERLNNHYADVVKVLQLDPDLGGNAIDLTFNEAGHSVSEDQQYAHMKVALMVRYRHRIADPYTPG